MVFASLGSVCNPVFGLLVALAAPLLGTVDPARAEIMALGPTLRAILLPLASLARSEADRKSVV